MTIRGPLYFNLTPNGDLNPTSPSMVGSRPATHTLYFFSTDFGGGGTSAYIAVMLTGEGEVMPPAPVITEAEFQLYGAEAVTPEVADTTDSAGGVTIRKDPA